MKKLISISIKISIFITISIFLNYLPIVYGANDNFMASPYVMISESLEGDSLPHGFAGFICNEEATLIGNDSSFHLDNPLGGKSQVSFELLVDNLNADSKIEFLSSDLKNSSETKFFEILFTKADKYSYNVAIDNSAIANIPFGETIKLTMNISSASAELFIIDAIGNYYTHNKEISLAFSGIHYSFDGKSYIKNFKILREDLFVSKLPVITDNGNVLTAGAKATNDGSAPEKYTLYLAEYDAETLTAVKTSDITLDNGKSGILEVSLSKSTSSAAYKAFLFSESLVPQAENAASVKTESYFEYTYLQKSVISGLETDITTKIENPSGLPICVRVISDSDIIENTYTKSQYDAGISYTFSQDGVYTVETFLCNDRNMVMTAKTLVVVYTPVENDTFVFSSGKNYYIRNDEKITFDGAYISNNEVYLPSDFYKTAGIIIDGTTAMRADITKEIGFSKIFSSVPLYSASEIFGAFGYYSFSKNGIIVISNDYFWSDKTIDSITDYYKETFLFHDFEGTVKNFSCFDWGTSTHLGENDWFYTTEEASSGTTSVYMKHSEKGFRGLFSSIYPKYDEECVGYRITFKAKASQDYSGNKIGVSAIFYTDGGIKYTSLFNTVPSNDSFNEYEILVPKNRFPVQEYSQIQFILTTTAVDGETYSGGVYFDDYRIEKYLNTEAMKISKTLEYSQTFMDKILCDSFEETISKNWSFYSWGTSTPSYGQDSSNFSDGEKSIYVAVPQDSFAGYITKNSIEATSPTKSIRVTADIYLSEDFSGGDASVQLLLYKDGASKGITSGEQIGTPEKGRWTTCEFYFTSMLLSKYDIDTVNVLLRTARSGNDTVSGKAYFDNVKISDEYTLSASIHSDITANKFASWYILGEEVVYNFDFENLTTVERIKGVVYNSNGEKVCENTLSASKVSSDGWRYVPDEVGYYEVAFFAVQSDGSQIPIVSSYDAAYLTDIETFELPRRSFAVVKSEAKPMSERNKKLFLSDGGNNPATLALGNLIGFYGIRLHFMTWGSTAGQQTGIEDTKDVYNWKKADLQMQNIKDAGYEGISLNILSTPKWAVPENISSLTGNTVAGMYNYNCYAPEDMTELEEFLKDLTSRYGDDVLIWEFWNEPQMGETAFWQDTPEKFSEMMKTAYSAIKSVDPEAVVSIGGLGANNSYYTFYDTIINDPEVYNSFDMLAIHGGWDDSAKLQSIATKKGYDKKPFWNSEGYYHAYYHNGVLADKTEQAMYFIMNNMQHFKQGSEIITHFSAEDYQPDEYRVFINNKKGSTHSMGLFRNHPYYEPKLGAVAAYNFYDLIENDFKYVGEYTFSETQKAVRFVNGGEPMLVLWNSADNNFTIDVELKECLENSKIVDMEGREIKGSVLNKKTMYFITDIEKEKLDLLPYTENSALNSDFEAPYYNCVLKENVSTNVTAELSNNRIFNPKTFELNENVLMITDGWNYKSNFDIERPEGFSAAYAMSADENGIYLLVDVTDNTHLANDEYLKFTDGDSVEFAIDCAGEGNANDRMEFTAVLTSNGPVLYKKVAADVGASLPENCSPAGTYLSGNCVNITRENNLTRYMIYIPLNELYPYSYPGIDKYIRTSIVVNNCDVDGENCYLEWGSGLANNEASPDKYGKITFECSMTTSNSDGKIILNGNADSNVMVSLMSTLEEEIVFVDQTESDKFGNFKFNTPLDSDKSYTFAISANGFTKNYYFEY